MIRRSLSLAAMATLIALTAGGCNAVLGFDEAVLDESVGGDPCVTYCDLMKKNCTGPNLEYIDNDKELCLAMCWNLDPGVTGETTNNSVACRTSHAQVAVAEAAFNCEAASPLGGEQCGINRCDAFCILEDALCQRRGYDSVDACRAACQNYAFDPSIPVGADQDKDTLNCRLYHLEAAFFRPGQDVTHCPHTGLISTTCIN